MLAAFKTNYFDELSKRGGNSHRAFRTAAIEPKQQAVSLIAGERAAGMPLLIQTSEWWLYWPLQYLAYAHDDVRVELRSLDDPRPLDQQAFDRMESWIVEFATEDAGWHVEKAWAALGEKNSVGLGAAKYVIRDAGGRKLLVLIRLPARQSSVGNGLGAVPLGE
jgi:hypothetical protein